MRFDGRLPESEVAKLRARLATLPPTAVAVIAGRAGLRTAHFIVGYPDEPSWPLEWKRRLIDRFVLACRAGRAALARGGAVDALAVPDDAREVFGCLTAAIEHERTPAGSLVAALAAVRAAIDPDPGEACVAAVVASVDAAFSHPSIDPGTTHAYGPPWASAAAAAAAGDVVAASAGVNASGIAARPLWPASDWGATMWPGARKALERTHRSWFASTPSTMSSGAPPVHRSLLSRVVDRFRSPTGRPPAIPHQEGLEDWVAWFDRHMHGTTPAGLPGERR